MKSHGLLVTVLLLAGIARPYAPMAQAQQPPSLIAEAARSVPAYRGSQAQSFLVVSAILKETRRVLIVWPVSYAQSSPERRYPLTLLTDGEYLLPAVAAVSDELSRNGQIPESVLVGIENLGGTNALSANQKRVFDLTPPGLSVSGSGMNAGGDRFLDFIEKELMPALEHQFRITGPCTFIGVSSGGVLATYAAATRPVFRAVVALDTPMELGDGWLVKKLLSRAGASDAALRYVSLEAKYGWPEEAWKKLVAAAPASWRPYRERIPQEGHETMHMIGSYLGLRQVFSDYSRLASPEAPTTSVLPYYAKVSVSFGATLMPPKRVLQDVVEDLINEGRGTAAREAFSMLVSGYGPPENSAVLSARIAAAERRPPPSETVEGLLATPFPTPAEVHAYLGEWIGDIWMGADAPGKGNTRLRIRIEDGRVVGETVRRTPAGEEQARRWDYLKITAAGITWGNLNGMRPRGVALFEGRLEGDILAGKMRFGGIHMDDPPPPLHFSFKHVHP